MSQPKFGPAPLVSTRPTESHLPRHGTCRRRERGTPRSCHRVPQQESRPPPIQRGEHFRPEGSCSQRRMQTRRTPPPTRPPPLAAAATGAGQPGARRRRGGQDGVPVRPPEPEAIVAACQARMPVVALGTGSSLAAVVASAVGRRTASSIGPVVVRILAHVRSPYVCRRLAALWICSSWAPPDQTCGRIALGQSSCTWRSWRIMRPWLALLSNVSVPCPPFALAAQAGAERPDRWGAKQRARFLGTVAHQKYAAVIAMSGRKIYERERVCVCVCVSSTLR